MISVAVLVLASADGERAAANNAAALAAFVPVAAWILVAAFLIWRRRHRAQGPGTEEDDGSGE